MSRPQGMPPRVRIASSAATPVASERTSIAGASVTAASRRRSATSDAARSVTATGASGGAHPAKGKRELRIRLGGRQHAVQFLALRALADADAVLPAELLHVAREPGAVALGHVRAARVRGLVARREMRELLGDEGEVALARLELQPERADANARGAGVGGGVHEGVEHRGIVGDPGEHRHDVDAGRHAGVGEPADRAQPRVGRGRARLEPARQRAVERDQRDVHREMRAPRDAREQVRVARDERALRDDRRCESPGCCASTSRMPRVTR